MLYEVITTIFYLILLALCMFISRLSFMDNFYNNFGIFTKPLGLALLIFVITSYSIHYTKLYEKHRYPDKVSVTIGFIPDLARRIYAGADMFLMPSQSEPCGLAQMFALRYGTIPIVRETGGLRDSITDCGEKGGNGFTFKTYNAHDMLGALARARAYYDKRMQWGKLVSHAMRQDFSWKRSAQLYLGLYKDI